MLTIKQGITVDTTCQCIFCSAICSNYPGAVNKEYVNYPLGCHVAYKFQILSWCSPRIFEICRNNQVTEPLPKTFSTGDNFLLRFSNGHFGTFWHSIGQLEFFRTEENSALESSGKIIFSHQFLILFPFIKFLDS